MALPPIGPAGGDHQEWSQRRDEQCEQPPECVPAQAQRLAAQVQHRQQVHANQGSNQQELQQFSVHLK